MLADLPGERKRPVFLVGRGPLRGHLQRPYVRDGTEVPVLQDQPADDLLEIQLVRPRTDIRAEGSHRQQAQVLLPLELGQRVLLEAGRHHHLDECGRDFLGGGEVHAGVERDHAAEGGGRIGLPRAHVRLARRGRDGRAAGIVVLDDDGRGLPVFLRQLQRGVGVQEIVVGHLLAVQLLGARHPRLAARAEVPIERPLLVRVLAVAQILHLLELQGEHGREMERARRALPLEVAGDHAVVPRGVLKDLARQVAPHRRWHLAPTQRVQHGPVVGRIDHHRHVGVVLGGRAQHRRPPDIDILDRLVEGAARFADRRFEGIEVDHHHVDGRNSLLRHFGDVLRVRAPAEQTAVDFGMERLDPPVQNLRRARVRRHVGDRHAGVPQGLRGPAGGKDFVALPRQSLRKLDDAGLLRHADQRPLHV